MQKEMGSTHKASMCNAEQMDKRPSIACHSPDYKFNGFKTVTYGHNLSFQINRTVTTIDQS